MNGSTADLIRRLQENKAQAEQIMHSIEGQQLLHMLAGNDGGEALGRAAEEASRGNTKDLAAMLSQMMRSPDGRALMQKLNDQAKQ